MSEITTMPEGQARALSEIAAEISSDWTRPYFGAVPYLTAMAKLSAVTDDHGAEPAAGIVRYFLANAQTWRGETARRIKSELNAMIKGRY
ncbi:hypothetical protein [Streptomyces phytophilus]|uniref:hypothetical protein n=1 Tax=Streptomyces phytophilus TaxID=722715 RepID=UPI0015F003B4|nr:hypothetical protein [Streptomyces phytophilus]